MSTDLVILAVGVRPEVELAKEAGLHIGDLGGIIVDSLMRTSDENIWAVGDAVEVKHFVSGVQSLIPLAGPANRQGLIGQRRHVSLIRWTIPRIALDFLRSVIDSSLWFRQKEALRDRSPMEIGT